MPWSGSRHFVASDSSSSSSQRPRVAVEREAGPRGLPHDVGELAVHVELQLRVRGIADAHRPGALAAGSQSSVSSVRRRSPPTPYMICSASGRRRPRGAPTAEARRLFAVAADSSAAKREASRRASSSTGSPSCGCRRSVSGSDVVGAATMPPVGSYVRHSSVSSERTTSSWCGPLEHALRRPRPPLVVGVARAARRRRRGVGRRCDGNHSSTNGTRSPRRPRTSRPCAGPRR